MFQFSVPVLCRCYLSLISVFRNLGLPDCVLICVIFLSQILFCTVESLLIDDHNSSEYVIRVHYLYLQELASTVLYIFTFATELNYLFFHLVCMVFSWCHCG